MISFKSATVALVAALAFAAGLPAWAVGAAYKNLGNARTMIFNDDTRSGRGNPDPIEDQDYWHTDPESGSCYWTHDDTAVPRGGAAMRVGVNHEFKTPEGKTLWTLHDARFGTIPASNSSGQYLPASPTTVATLQTGTTYLPNGSALLRNSTNSWVSSSVLTDGIGSIYFDVVNSGKANLICGVVLEYATTVNGGEELREGDEDDICDWKVCEVGIRKITGCNTLGEELVANRVALAATGGATNEFYRVCGKLDYRGPVKFRIRRDSIDGTGVEALLNMLIIDNILASYPATDAVITPFGEVNEDLSGAQTLGIAPAFSVPFPAAGEENVKARVAVEYLTNAAYQISTRIANAKLYYRWRYLDQIIGDWQMVDLVDSGDGKTFESAEALNLFGGVGDIEFYCLSDLDSVYYRFVDWALGDGAISTAIYNSNWREERAKAEMRAGYEEKTAAGGYDYFIRLREGASQYEQVNLVYTRQIETEDEQTVTVIATNALEVVGEHLWRGFVEAPTSGTVECSFRFEGIGFTTNGAEKVGSGRILWTARDERIGVEGAKYPFTGSIVPAADAGRDWAVAEMDASQGYLMFEFNDETMTFVATRADYQNFNLWSDAIDHFIGSSSYTTGVSRVKRSYPLLFTNIVDSSTSTSTNSYWEEHFDSVAEADIDRLFPRNKFFTSSDTPAYWTAGYGMFVAESYLKNGLEFQMMGRGMGNIAMQNLAVVPNGVDSISFRARLAQFIEYENYAYNEAAIADSDYAVCARVRMSEEGFLGMSPNTPSISLVGHWRPGQGGYEFRVTRTDAYKFKLDIYKWVKEGSAMTSSSIASKELTEADFGGDKNVCSNWLVAASSGVHFNNMYFVLNNVGGKVQLKGGISKDAVTYAAQLGMSDTDYFTIAVTNASPGKLTRGAYGVGSCDCYSRFYLIQHQPVAGGIANYDPSGNPNSAMDGINERDAILQDDSWYVPIGRMETFDGETISYQWGLKGVVTPQKVKVFISTAQKNIRWEECPQAEDVVVSDFSHLLFSCKVQNVSNCYVRLQHGGDPLDPRTDVVVNDIVINSYRGIPTEKLDYAADYSAHDWVWTEAWLEEIPGSRNNRCRCILDPARAMPGNPLGIRSPLMGGLSVLNFEYSGASADTVLRVQYCTNLTDRAWLVELSKSLEGVEGGGNWIDDCTLRFDGSAGALPAGSGKVMIPFPYRAPVPCVVRVIMDPSIVNRAAAGDAAARAATVTITSAHVWDEPELDEHAWWGWNMMTTRKGAYSYLPDPSVEPVPGMSGALNNSNTRDTAVTPGDGDYSLHNPFVQSPVSSNGIGSVSFKVRKFDPAGPDAVVTLLGSADPGAGDKTGAWKVLANFTVSEPTFTIRNWNTSEDESDLKAVRLMVCGVNESRDEEGAEKANPPVRVAIDEVVVAETIAAQVSFGTVLPFRSDLQGTTEIYPLAGNFSEQPLAGENFGIQAEVHMQQLTSELSPENVRVYCAVFGGTSPWGYENWKDLPGATSFELPRSTDNPLVFRSTFEQPLSVLNPFNDGKPGTIVQYHVWAEYESEGASGETIRRVHHLTRGEWTGGRQGVYPTWYWPFDGNAKYSADGSFAAYTILDSVSPYRVWINEVNLNDGNEEDVAPDQFIEVAVPQGVDLTGWYIQAYDNYGKSARIAEFGFDDVVAKKTANATNHYSFIHIQSPAAKAKGRKADGTWTTAFPEGVSVAGRYSYFDTYGFEIVNKLGVVQHQVVVEGTNYYAGTYGEIYFSGTNLVRTLRQKSEGSSWFFGGADLTDGTTGVMSGHGEEGTWEEDLAPTAGLVNRRRDGTAQDIDEHWFLPPNGTNVWLYCTVSGDHLYQESGLLNAKSFVIIVPQGGSTNIAYTADPWWSIGSLSVGESEVAAAAGKSRYTLELSNLSNSLEVTAVAAPSPAVTNGTGIASDSPYLPEIMKWLENFEEGDLYRAARYRASNGHFISYLTLEDMYWFDIPPVVEAPAEEYGWRFYSDLTPVGTIPYVDRYGGQDVSLEDYRISLFMMITNTVTGEAHAPETIQTYGNVSSAESYTMEGDEKWNGVTFKIEGCLNDVAPGVWIPLRYFVFGADSFAGEEEENPFTAIIDIQDPFFSASPSFVAGWSRFRGSYPWFRWRIGDERMPGTVEVLHKDSTYAHPDAP